VVEHTRGDDCVIAGKRVRHVGNAFPRSEAELIGLQIDRMTADLRRRQLHRVARARAWFLEIKRNTLAFDDAPRRPLRQHKDGVDVSRGQVADRKEVLHQLFSLRTIVPTP
jgi:hypothetical protein